MTFCDDVTNAALTDIALQVQM